MPSPDIGRVLSSSWHKSPFSENQALDHPLGLKRSHIHFWSGLGWAWAGCISWTVLLSKWSSKLILQLTLSSKEIQSVDLTDHQINIWSMSSCGEKKAPSGMPEMMGNGQFLLLVAIPTLPMDWLTLFGLLFLTKSFSFFFSSYL